jgi:hypothetical protein
VQGHQRRDYSGSAAGTRPARMSVSC